MRAAIRLEHPLPVSFRYPVSVVRDRHDDVVASKRSTDLDVVAAISERIGEQVPNDLSESTAISNRRRFIGDVDVPELRIGRTVQLTDDLGQL